MRIYLEFTFLVPLEFNRIHGVAPIDDAGTESPAARSVFLSRLERDAAYALRRCCRSMPLLSARILDENCAC